MLLQALLLLACSRDKSATTVSYKAEVVNTSDINCSRPVLQIDPADTAAVSRISGVYTDFYVASQLPAALNSTGRKITITIDKFAPGEDFACGSIGISYPHLKITGAVSRN